jgi:ubiquinone/menaquinone biosynthesis C-methylase UbiE
MQLMQSDITRTCMESEVYESLLQFDGAAVLELGCGKAAHTRKIAAAHPTARITAAEVDKIQHAKNIASAPLPNVVFTDFGAQAIALTDSTVDIIMMFKSLHHVPVASMDQALNEIHRVLKPGGRAYLSEPLFAGDLNELTRIYHDEEAVRIEAFGAIRRAIETRRFELVSETFFLENTHYKDFAEFEQRHFKVTHSERNVTPAQREQILRLFNSHLRPDGVTLAHRMRVDLLRKLS